MAAGAGRAADSPQEPRAAARQEPCKNYFKFIFEIIFIFSKIINLGRVRGVAAHVGGAQVGDGAVDADGAGEALRGELENVRK